MVEPFAGRRMRLANPKGRSERMSSTVTAVMGSFWVDLAGRLCPVSPWYPAEFRQNL
jgi:hypothetical protein